MARAGGRIRYGFAVGCTRELLERVARRARGGGGVYTHASENRTEYAMVERAAI